MFEHIIAFECIIYPGCSADGDCKNNGVCNTKTHICACDDGFTGDSCQNIISKLDWGSILETYTPYINVTIPCTAINACQDNFC